jgi:sodium-dependent phosphate transporter
MYLWILIVGGIFAFTAAMGIGANDAANAFATSIGSKALTIHQAVVLAVIFESLGAILMGSHVTDTIRKGIVNYECFQEQPYTLMYGSMWVLLSVTLWLFLASKWEMPVSTTHSCVGGMIGIGIALGGTHCVNWYEPKDTFPFVGGVGGIVASWVISPVFSALIAIALFGTTRALVLRKKFESMRSNIAYCILVGSVVTINSFFIIYKGAKGLGLHKTELGTAMGISFGLGTLSALVTIPIVPCLKQKAVPQEGDIELPDTIFNDEKEATCVAAIHENAEKFDVRTEELFKYLQIFTAICDSFSHGANDVANAMGPFAVIWAIFQAGELDKKTDMGTDAYWILALGGVGIALGLLVYGHKITRAIGDKLCKITPSRGTAIELGSALVIIIGSRLGLPLSTTHCQVGATVGVGLLEGRAGVNRWICGKTVIGWVVTCAIVGLTSGVLVAQGVYSPGPLGTNATII